MSAKTLTNKTILITRNIDADTEFHDLMEKHGANVIHLPTIKIIPADNYTDFDRHVKELSKYDYLIFSSANAVKFFAGRITEIEETLNLDHIKIIAVGTATARVCEKYKLPADLIPEEFSAKGVFEVLNKIDLNNKNILIPSSVIANQELKTLLAQQGALVSMIPVYNNIIPPVEEISEQLQLVKHNKPDLFIFTSPSTFRNFIKLLEIQNVKKYFEATCIATIGSVTAAAISENGLTVDIIPDKFTMNSLVEKIVQYYSH